jgi:hypothetical protein
MKHTNANTHDADSRETNDVVNHQCRRLGLVDPGTASPAVSKAFARLPVINVFRAMANAESLYPAFIDFLSLLFRPLEIDPALERMIVLRVALLGECFYAWRQNVVVARSVSVTEEQISALERGDIVAKCFSPAQQASGLRFHRRSSVHGGNH